MQLLFSEKPSGFMSDDKPDKNEPQLYVDSNKGPP